MEEILKAIADRYLIFASGVMERLGSSSHSWRFEDVSGKRWVLKTTVPDSRTFAILQSFPLLFPPFRHPQPVSQLGEPYLLYPYIDGTSLEERLFDDPEISDQVIGVIDRLPALMRSLVLIPQFEQTLRSINSGRLSGRGGEVAAATDPQGGSHALQDNHQRVNFDRSLKWTEVRAKDCCNLARTSDIWSETLLGKFQKYMDGMQSIHYAIAGNNLAHTALVPEHLLLGPDATLAVLGWRLEPRPRFYMLHSYLSWCALHSNRPDAFDDYQATLSAGATRPFHDQHLLMAAFCLLDQMERCSEGARPRLTHTHNEKAVQAERLFKYCVEGLDALKTTHQRQDWEQMH